MRRLSVARDRELRHVVAQRVAWRFDWETNSWYPWCRVCSRDASKQVFWLAGEGYVHLPYSDTSAHVNVQPTDHATPYLEKYPSHPLEFLR